MQSGSDREGRIEEMLFDKLREILKNRSVSRELSSFLRKLEIFYRNYSKKIEFPKSNFSVSRGFFEHYFCKISKLLAIFWTLRRNFGSCPVSLMLSRKTSCYSTLPITKPEYSCKGTVPAKRQFTP